MQRRHFLQKSALSSLGIATVSTSALANPHLFMDAAPFSLNYAFHDGMFAENAGKDFIDQIKFGYDQGFRAIEDNGMMARSMKEQEQIGTTLRNLGMKMGVFVITSDGWHWKTSLTTGLQEWKDKLLKDCNTAIEVAKRCGATWMTVVPGNYDRSQPLERQTSHVIDALRRASDILAPHGLVMVLEALSDNPDLFLRNTAQTTMICKAVASPACKFLFDMYHMQRNEGNIITNLKHCWDEIAYLQIGDNPGRKEPTTGEMNYKNIFTFIQQQQFTGILGMEHGNSLPGKAGEMALIKAYREVDPLKR